MRPSILGAAPAAVARDAELCDAMFDVLEAQNLLQNQDLRVTVICSSAPLLSQFTAARNLESD